jgi:hypothetical protein
VATLFFRYRPTGKIVGLWNWRKDLAINDHILTRRSSPFAYAFTQNENEKINFVNGRGGNPVCFCLQFLHLPYLFKGTSNKRGEAFQNLDSFFFEEFTKLLYVVFFVCEPCYFSMCTDSFRKQKSLNRLFQC